MVGTTLLVRCARTVVLAPAWRVGLCAALCLTALSCGGGGGSVASLASGGSGSSGSSTPTGSNVVSVVVDAGPTSTSPDVNTLFTTVTICVPGTSSCQTIDHIQVDTGSYGLRILAPVLTVALPVQTFTNGASLLECTKFVDGYSWGPVALADVQISNETANSVPVQIIGDANFTNVPGDCSSAGPAEDTVATFGANGVLGVGVFASDCGTGCATTIDNDRYYSCTSTLCEPTTVALASQVTDPVALFAMDNNGVIIQLPTVAAQGAATVTGSMIFGIDTQTNNKSGGQKVLTVDPNFGYFTTVFNGQSLNQSFLDTGSNGLYFNDKSIGPCKVSTDFYCPATTQSFSATLQGQNDVSASVSFSVGDADTLGGNDASLVAFPTLAGPFTSSADDATATFDWGLPFFYGRTVYTAFENESTAVGTGPYVAF
jgi:Protein of unknown function (DUF3443)